MQIEWLQKKNVGILHESEEDRLISQQSWEEDLKKDNVENVYEKECLLK